MKYKKKPLVIDAFRFRKDPYPDWFTEKIGDQSIITYGNFLIIRTLEGEMMAERGDYIVRGIEGEVYPCKPRIFEATYDPVETNDK
jgi:hypothetical protein